MSELQPPQHREKAIPLTLGYLTRDGALRSRALFGKGASHE